ncbi:hypothetical protein J4558_21705 [Leptolyngbya sp. 15MV]|nr:hypothetical protein J4558_21705 [Leptolyngbya sp. 15MV]
MGHVDGGFARCAAELGGRDRDGACARACHEDGDLGAFGPLVAVEVVLPLGCWAWGDDEALKEVEPLGDAVVAQTRAGEAGRRERQIVLVE